MAAAGAHRCSLCCVPASRPGCTHRKGSSPPTPLGSSSTMTSCSSALAAAAFPSAASACARLLARPADSVSATPTTTQISLRPASGITVRSARLDAAGTIHGSPVVRRCQIALRAQCQLALSLVASIRVARHGLYAHKSASQPGSLRLTCVDCGIAQLERKHTIIIQLKVLSPLLETFSAGGVEHHSMKRNGSAPTAEQARKRSSAPRCKPSVLSSQTSSSDE